MKCERTRVYLPLPARLRRLCCRPVRVPSTPVPACYPHVRAPLPPSVSRYRDVPVTDRRASRRFPANPVAEKLSPARAPADRVAGKPSPRRPGSGRRRGTHPAMWGEATLFVLPRTSPGGASCTAGTFFWRLGHSLGELPRRLTQTPYNLMSDLIRSAPTSLTATSPLYRLSTGFPIRCIPISDLRRPASGLRI